ncbi:hypothetical protein BD560DRAFT_415902 [Blakeslea trispora]|nr:hypothetical protein BD560DRAFT_415902 [Blakeslea trispora]
MMMDKRNLHVNTLALWRSAILRFHTRPDSISNHPTLVSFLQALKNKAPPIEIHRSSINLQPTLDAIKAINNTTRKLRDLQRKTAFLLGMAAFLRPCDICSLR